MNGAIVNALVTRALRDHGGRCELVGIDSSGPCAGTAVAVRFDGFFIDLVCAEHAARAEARPGVHVVTRPGETS